MTLNPGTRSASTKILVTRFFCGRSWNKYKLNLTRGESMTEEKANWSALHDIWRNEQ
jgi:hypothetical protein